MVTEPEQDAGTLISLFNHRAGRLWTDHSIVATAIALTCLSEQVTRVEANEDAGEIFERALGMIVALDRVAISHSFREIAKCAAAIAKLDLNAADASEVAGEMARSGGCVFAMDRLASYPGAPGRYHVFVRSVDRSLRASGTGATLANAALGAFSSGLAQLAVHEHISTMALPPSCFAEAAVQDVPALELSCRQFGRSIFRSDVAKPAQIDRIEATARLLRAPVGGLAVDPTRLTVIRQMPVILEQARGIGVSQSLVRQCSRRLFEMLAGPRFVTENHRTGAGLAWSQLVPLLMAIGTAACELQLREVEAATARHLAETVSQMRALL